MFRDILVLLATIVLCIYCFNNLHRIKHKTANNYTIAGTILVAVLITLLVVTTLLKFL